MRKLFRQTAIALVACAAVGFGWVVHAPESQAQVFPSNTGSTAVSGYTPLQLQQKLNNNLAGALRGDTGGAITAPGTRAAYTAGSTGIAEIQALVAPGLIVAIGVVVAFVGFHMVRRLIMKVRG